ncbi:MAG: SLC13 family permease [Bacteroidia bacterium]
MKTSWLLKLLSGPFFFFLIITYTNLSPENPNVSLMAGITVWIAFWWLTEVVDLAVTSLLPLILLPTMGILDAKTTASQYNDQVIFLFVGGFILSFAIEKWNLHKRISLKILSLIGTSPVNILAGVMFTSYFISMWMSNTATVMMLLAAVIAINYNIQQEIGETIKNKIPSALLLGLAYSASIGGMATLVGTPTNMIFYSFYQSNLPDAEAMTFTKWFAVAFPISLTLLIGTFFILRYKFITKASNIKFDKSYFKDAYKKLGPFSFEEKTVTLLFSITAFLWFTRSNMDFGNFKFYGWGKLFDINGKEFVLDSTVAIFMAFLLFIIPSKKEKGQHILIWEDAKKIPYDIILLFGSGFAIAKGFEVSGLSNWLAAQLNFLKGVHPFFMIASICAVVCLISEFASNVASIQLALPILLVLSTSLQIDPFLLMIPATLAASLGYILPVATAPNTIVYGSKLFPVKHMLSVGAIIDILGIILISVSIYIFI